MSEFEIDEIYVLYKDLLVSKLALIQIDKDGSPLVAQQKYDEINVLISKRNEIYQKIQELQMRMNFLLDSGIPHDSFLDTIDFKTSFEQIDENTIPELKKVLEVLEMKKEKTPELLVQIQLLNYFIN
jgi:hypothetical protein